jgi:hypothetical protein
MLMVSATKGGIAIDVAIVDSQTADSQTGGTDAKLQRRALATRLAARRKEAEMRNKRREAGHLPYN